MRSARDVRSLLAMPDGTLLMADTRPRDHHRPSAPTASCTATPAPFGATFSYVLDVDRRAPGSGSRTRSRLGRDGSVYAIVESDSFIQEQLAGASSASGPTASSCARWAGARPGALRPTVPTELESAVDRCGLGTAELWRSTATACRCSTTARRTASAGSSRRSASGHRRRRSRPVRGRPRGVVLRRLRPPPAHGRRADRGDAARVRLRRGRAARARRGRRRPQDADRARRGGRADGDRRAGRAAHAARGQRRRAACRRSPTRWARRAGSPTTPAAGSTTRTCRRAATPPTATTRAAG